MQKILLVHEIQPVQRRIGRARRVLVRFIPDVEDETVESRRIGGRTQDGVEDEWGYIVHFSEDSKVGLCLKIRRQRRKM
jgi:hypothetical protein